MTCSHREWEWTQSFARTHGRPRAHVLIVGAPSAGVNPDQRCLTSEVGFLAHWRNGHSADTPDKAGPLGCMGKHVAAGQPTAIAVTKTHAAQATSCEHVAAPAAERSGFVRCVCGLSVSPMSVETSQ